jgi:hypothetical protein
MARIAMTGASGIAFCKIPMIGITAMAGLEDGGFPDGPDC